MVHELRIYYVVPGRMQRIFDRFRDDTLALFDKHNMPVSHFWVDEDESVNRLYYIFEHENMEARERNFKAFQDDPAWKALKEKTEYDGLLYEKIDVFYMKDAPFWPRKK